jgi:hypothetical protein
MRVMRADEIITRRMHNNHLWGPPLDRAEDLVRRLGAMQSQEFVPAMWSIAQRTSRTNIHDIKRLFSEGTILRTHLLRPTWHFVAAEDIRWVLEATAPRVHMLNGHMYRREGVDDDLAERCAQLLAEALRGGGQLTRKELAVWFGRNGVEASGVRLAYILMRAELDALICSGARKGKQHTYALLDERAPGARVLGADGALAELTRRYFSTRGPATVKDYTKWSSLTMAQARSGLEMVEAEFERVEVGQRVYWTPVAPHPAPNGPVVDLIQGYDEIVSSYGESRDLILSEVGIPGTNPDPPFLHTILLDGRLAGHWKPSLGREELTVDTTLYRALDAAEDAALGQTVQRLGDFYSMPARLA